MKFCLSALVGVIIKMRFVVVKVLVLKNTVL